MARETALLDALLAGRLEASRGRAATLRDDDVAVLPTPSEGVAVATTDALEEGEHFLPGWLSIEDLAWKVLAISLSDLAAAGATPTGWLLALSLPESFVPDDARRLGRAVAAAERDLACPLLGGDTDATRGPLRLASTAFGVVPSAPLGRAGAKAGDLLFVSGPLGGAALAVSLLLAGKRPAGDADLDDAFRRFARPVPRLDLGRRLAGLATTVMDLSDDLTSSVARLARASGLAAEVDAAAVPRHPSLAARREERLALAGGEDYELLVAGPASLSGLGLGLARVGRLVAGAAGRVTVQGAEGSAGPACPGAA